MTEQLPKEQLCDCSCHGELKVPASFVQVFSKEKAKQRKKDVQVRLRSFCPATGM